MFRTILLAVFTYCCGGVWGGSVYREGGAMLRDGQWRAVLQRKDGQQIVFNFEVKDSAGKKILYIRNAGERLLVDDITTQGDSLFIHLPFFESQFRVVVTAEGNLEGVWLKRGATAYSSIPLKAFYGQTYRFAPGGRAKASVGGRWSAVFRSPDGKDTSMRVGEFRQEGDRVTGTFLDPTGDFRYLEGVVDGDSLRLSCFDGGHAFLFTAKIDNDSSISGGQYFSGGGAGCESWTAYKNANAALPDEFGLAKLNADAGPVHFTFRDIDGKPFSFPNEHLKGKVVILQIMGSWCPNCMDETHFLSPFYDQYHSKGVEIIGLAYERTTDFARSQTSLRTFQQRFQVKYPMLITGVTVSDPDNAQKTLPQLQKIVGFPTTIFIDKKGVIRKVHTGFSGPGTGDHYADQQKEFYQLVDALLAE